MNDVHNTRRPSVRPHGAARPGWRCILYVLGAVALHCTASACPSCYGTASGPVVDAANTAVLAMLGITGSVISGIAAFFFVLVRRAKQYAGDGTTEDPANIPGGR